MIQRRWGYIGIVIAALLGLVGCTGKYLEASTVALVASPMYTPISVLDLLPSLPAPSATVLLPTATILSSATVTPLPTTTPRPSSTVMPTLALSPSPTRPRTAVMTPSIPLIPDSELVNSPTASTFDLDAFINAQSGVIHRYNEIVAGRMMTASDIIRFVSTSMSLHPRLLLALLEYQGGWLSDAEPSGFAMSYPLGWDDPSRSGLFNQLIWAGHQLQDGYYGWKQRGVTYLTFPDGVILPYDPELSAGTIAVQNLFGQVADTRAEWLAAIRDGGFLSVYQKLFGDPFAHAIQPLMPAALQQPLLQLPFPASEMWYFTSGPHGAWGRVTSGWAAIDFAPPREPDNVPPSTGKCYTSPYWVTAVADGIVTQADDGVLVLDLDMDGDDHTGWAIVYLHIAEQDRVKVGTRVQAGQAIGHASCEGFYLNAQGTHLHISRRYNGEWIAADCGTCFDEPSIPFILSGWQVHGYPRRPNEGWIEKDGQQRTLYNGRDPNINGLMW